MRDAALGALMTIVVLVACGLGAIELGLVPAGADVRPSAFERWAARTSLRASIRRDEGRSTPPGTIGDAGVAHGIALYAADCAFCHGAADGRASTAALGFGVPAPQLAIDGVEDDAETETYWKLVHGIRFTAMPAFGGRLSATDLWQITAFLKTMNALPPPLEAAWKAVPSAARPSRR